MVEQVAESLAGYASLEEVAMALAKMRMRRTVRNADEEFARRYMAEDGTSENKSPACAFLPPRRQWGRQGPRARRGKSSTQLQVGAIMHCIHSCERDGTLEKTAWGRRLVGLVAELQGQVARQEFAVVPPRSATVPKHVLKLKKETGETIDRLADEGVPLRAGVSPQEFYTAFMRRIVAKGVGYMKSGAIPTDGICWAAAFPNMTQNVPCARQMRMLDRVRSRCLGALRRVLELKEKALHFAGRPYSYFGYLMKMVRPAYGMKGASVAVRFPYSEL